MSWQTAYQDPDYTLLLKERRCPQQWEWKCNLLPVIAGKAAFRAEPEVNSCGRLQLWPTPGSKAYPPWRSSALHTEMPTTLKPRRTLWWRQPLASFGLSGITLGHRCCLCHSGMSSCLFRASSLGWVAPLWYCSFFPSTFSVATSAMKATLSTLRVTIGQGAPFQK